MNPRARWLVPLLFGSGMCALVYQVAWFREFRLVFGASTAATSAVLAVFVAGLGAGGLVLGGRADRHPKPVLLYGRLEALIALFAAVTPALLWVARQIYISTGGAPALGALTGTALRLLLTAVVLAAPTFLMGGTLPAAARGAETRDGVARRGTALLYGVNTLGAVVGCAISTFFMLEHWGTRATLWVACGVNLVIALAAQYLGSREAKEEAPVIAVRPISILPPPQEAAAPSWFTLTAAAVVGFAFFLMEMVWYRMLGPILGGTVFTFGLILAVALLGIGLGGAAYAWLGRNKPATLSGFAATCLAEALLMAIPYALGDRVAVVTLLLRSFGVFGFSGMLFGWTCVAFLVVLPAAFVAGAQFPLLIALLGRGREHVGRQVGLAYAFNTLGAIAGSLGGGFGMLPALTAPGCWRAVVGLLVVSGLTAGVLAVRGGARRTPLVGAAAIGATTLLMLRAEGPTAVWRHSPIGVGRVESEATASESALRAWMHEQRRALRWEAEGVESSVALSNSEGWAFIVNGKIDGSARGDASTQVMGGLVGAILHPEPKNAMVIGLGTGSTAGWLGAVPSIEQVDVVELEPAILSVARACRSVNHDVMDNPKVKIAIGDAREILLTAKQRYDIVFSEPSNPYRAGIASLFTHEYYEAIAARLREGGLFLQWVQAYNVDAQAVRTIYATLASVFPHVETWELAANDLLLVASRAPVVYDAAALREKIAGEPYRTALASTWRAVDLESFFAHYVARSSMARGLSEVERGRLNTDDRTLVEFGFARMSADDVALSGKEIRAAARARDEHRPEQVVGEIDWARADEEWMSFLIAEEEGGDAPEHFDKDQRARFTALSFYLAGDVSKAVSSWFSQRREPRSPTELAAIAESLASLGDERARTYVERIRPRQPVEADAILARLLARQGKTKEATAAIEAMFERYRRDVWPWFVITRHAFDTVDEVARADASMGERLYRALAAPLPVYLHEDRRLSGMLKIAERGGDLTAPCEETLALFEPYVPWQKEALELRARCYEKSNHPRAAAAKRDLAEFSAQKAVPFESGLLPAPVAEGR